jgi:hypothetical protein
MPVNGRVWAFEDLSLTLIGGRRQTFVQSIDYGDQVPKEHAHALGSIAPRGIGRGVYTAEGNLTLLRDGFDELLAQLAVRRERLYGVQFSANVTYGEEDGDLSVDELPLCEFTSVKSGGKVGDTKLEVQLGFIVVDPIVRNGVQAV